MSSKIAIGIVHMPKRGSYQLNPAVALRGGMMEVDVAPSAGPAITRKSAVRKRVDQLDLLGPTYPNPPRS